MTKTEPPIYSPLIEAIKELQRNNPDDTHVSFSQVYAYIEHFVNPTPDRVRNADDMGYPPSRPAFELSPESLVAVPDSSSEISFNFLVELVATEIASHYVNAKPQEYVTVADGVLMRLQPYLRTTVPVSVEVCARAYAKARDKLHNDAGHRETAIELSKAVLDAAGVKYS